MKRLLVCLLTTMSVPGAYAAPNQLYNGGFELTFGSVYYDGFDPSAADDVPGWVISLGAADGSYVLVAPEANLLAGGADLDMGAGPAGGAIETAASSRPSVIPLAPYEATVTTDNYFAPTGAAYFIDWYDAGGSRISSDGGVLGDPNGPLTFAPYTQLLSITASAPLTAASAGVRFEGGNAGYAGLTADNFHFGVVPEPGHFALASLAAMGWTGVRRHRRSN